MFLKYRSLENHYNLIPDYLNLEMMVTVTEKLDGSNCSIIINEEDIAYASRNQLVDSTWNNLGGLIPSSLIPVLKEQSKNLGQINLYGEVFSSKILKRIPYGEPKVIFFDMSINGEYLSGKEFNDFMVDIEHSHLCPQAVIMTLKQALNINIEQVQSMYAESLAEGLVIKPWNSSHINGRVGAIKFKSKNFQEISGDKIKTPKSLSAQQVEFCKYVNENRVLSYISKEGEPSDMKDIGKYIKGILEDAFEEYCSSLSETESMVAHEDRSIMKAGSKIIVPILKARIMGTSI
jgi:hypothetical protein